MGSAFPHILAAKLVRLVLTVADAPPKFNVAPGCKAASAIDQSMDLAVSQDYQSCMKDEEGARQELVQKWSKFKPEDRRPSWRWGYAELRRSARMPPGYR
jgi:hypothetical protein